MVEPNPYGVVTFRLKNMAPLYKHLLNGTRPWIKEDTELGRTGDDVRYALIRSNQWNILLTDTCNFDIGYGPETIFTALTDTLKSNSTTVRSPTGGGGGGTSTSAAVSPSTVRASSSSSSPSLSSSSTPNYIVAPFQLINHLPNIQVFTHTAYLIKALNRQYTSTSTHVFDILPTTYYIAIGGNGSTTTNGTVLSSSSSSSLSSSSSSSSSLHTNPVLNQFFKRFHALAHGQYDISNVRMPPKQCEYNMWIIKPAESGTSKEAIIVNSVTDITTFLTHCRKDMIIQKLIERPLIVNNFKCSIRLYILITDSGDVFVYRAPLVHLASLPYVPVTVGETSTAEECTQVHVTSSSVQYTAPGFGNFVRGNTLSWHELQHYLDTNYPVGTFPPKVLDTIILPRMKRIIVDAVRGAFASPLPSSVGTSDTMPTSSSFGSSSSSSLPTVTPVSLSSNPRAGFRGRRCFEFLSGDFVLDEDLRPWFLGFNENPELNSELTSRHAVTYERMVQEMVTTVIDPLFPAPVLSQSPSTSPLRTNKQPSHGYPNGGPLLPTPGFSSNDYMTAVADTPTGPTALQMTMSGQKNLIQRTAEARANSGSSIQRQPQDITNSTVTIPPHRFLLPSIDDDDDERSHHYNPNNPLNLPTEPSLRSTVDPNTVSSTTTTLPSIVGFEPDSIAPFWELVHRSIAAEDVETPAYTSMMLAVLSNHGNPINGIPSTANRINNAVQLQISEALSLTLPPRSRSIMSIPSYAFLGPVPTPHKLAWLGIGKPQSELLTTHLPSVLPHTKGLLTSHRHESIVSGVSGIANSVSPGSVGKYTTVDSADRVPPRPILPPELRPSMVEENSHGGKGNERSPLMKHTFNSNGSNGENTLPIVPEYRSQGDGNSYTQDDEEGDDDEGGADHSDPGSSSPYHREHRYGNLPKNGTNSSSASPMERTNYGTEYRSRSPGYEVVQSRSNSPTNYLYNNKNGDNEAHPPSQRTGTSPDAKQGRKNNHSNVPSDETLRQLATLLTATGLSSKIDQRSLPALAHLLHQKKNDPIPTNHPTNPPPYNHPPPPSSQQRSASSTKTHTKGGSKGATTKNDFQHPSHHHGVHSTTNGKPLLNTLSARARANAVARKMNHGTLELKKSSRWANVPSRTDTGQTNTSTTATTKGGGKHNNPLSPPPVPHRSAMKGSSSSSLVTQDTAIYVEDSSLSTLARAEIVPDGPRHQRATAASTARKLPYDQYLQQQPKEGEGEGYNDETRTINPSFVLDGRNSTGNGSSNSSSPPSKSVPSVGNGNDMKGLLLQLLTVLQTQQQQQQQQSVPSQLQPPPASTATIGETNTKSIPMVPAPSITMNNTAQSPVVPVPFTNPTTTATALASSSSSSSSTVPVDPPVVPTLGVAKPRPVIVNEFSAYASVTLPSSSSSSSSTNGTSTKSNNNHGSFPIRSTTDTSSSVPHKFITSASSAYIQDPLANHSTKLSSIMKTTLQTPIHVPSQPGSYEMMLAAPYLYPSKGEETMHPINPTAGERINTTTTGKTITNRMDLVGNGEGTNHANAYVLPTVPTNPTVTTTSTMNTTTNNTNSVSSMFLPSLAGTNPTITPLTLPLNSRNTTSSTTTTANNKPIVPTLNLSVTENKSDTVNTQPPLPLPPSSSASSSVRTPTVQFILPTVSYKKGGTTTNGTNTSGSSNTDEGSSKTVNVDDLLRSERIPTNQSSNSNNTTKGIGMENHGNSGINLSSLGALTKRPVMTTVSFSNPTYSGDGSTGNGSNIGNPIIATMDASPLKNSSSNDNNNSSTVPVPGSGTVSRHTFGNTNVTTPQLAILQELSTNPPTGNNYGSSSNATLTFPTTPAMTVATNYARISAAALAAAAASGKAVAMPLGGIGSSSNGSTGSTGTNTRISSQGSGGGLSSIDNFRMTGSTTTNTVPSPPVEIWIRVKNPASDGTQDPFYYYHRETRVTVWDPPSGKNVQIVDQV